MNGPTHLQFHVELNAQDLAWLPRRIIVRNHSQVLFAGIETCLISPTPSVQRCLALLQILHDDVVAHSTRESPETIETIGEHYLKVPVGGHRRSGILVKQIL